MSFALKSVASFQLEEPLVVLTPPVKPPSFFPVQVRPITEAVVEVPPVEGEQEDLLEFPDSDSIDVEEPAQTWNTTQLTRMIRTLSQPSPTVRIHRAQTLAVPTSQTTIRTVSSLPRRHRLAFRRSPTLSTITVQQPLRSTLPTVHEHGITNESSMPSPNDEEQIWTRQRPLLPPIQLEPDTPPCKKMQNIEENSSAPLNASLSSQEPVSHSTDIRPLLNAMKRTMMRQAQFAVGMVLIYWLVFSIVMVILEGWSAIEGFYFSFSVMSTIGKVQCDCNDNMYLYIICNDNIYIYIYWSNMR